MLCPGFLFGIFESAELTQLLVMHGMGLSNSLNPVSMFPNGTSAQEYDLLTDPSGSRIIIDLNPEEHSQPSNWLKLNALNLSA